MTRAEQPPDFRPETRLAIVAIEGALNLTPVAAGPQATTAKGVRDIVIETDLAIEDSIRVVLNDGPGFPVVGEERGGEAPSDGTPYWLLDPLCAARNFAAGIPLFFARTSRSLKTAQSRSASWAARRRARSMSPSAAAVLGALKDSGARRLSTSDASTMVVVEGGKVDGARRDRLRGSARRR